MWISFLAFFFFVEGFSCQLKFVIKTEPNDLTHLFKLTLGLRQLFNLPEAIFVETVIEPNTNILLVVYW